MASSTRPAVNDDPSAAPASDGPPVEVEEEEEENVPLIPQVAQAREGDQMIR